MRELSKRFFHFLENTGCFPGRRRLFELFLRCGDLLSRPKRKSAIGRDAEFAHWRREEGETVQRRIRSFVCYLRECAVSALFVIDCKVSLLLVRMPAGELRRFRPCAPTPWDTPNEEKRSDPTGRKGSREAK